jgi:hypothetical protein
LFAVELSGILQADFVFKPKAILSGWPRLRIIA